MSGKTVTAILAALSAFCLCMALLTAGVLAQPVAQHCGPRAEIAAALAQKYKEIPAGVGIINDRAVMELFLSPQGTWTLLLSSTQGFSCIHGAGEGWQFSTEAIRPGQGT